MNRFWKRFSDSECWIVTCFSGMGGGMLIGWGFMPSELSWFNAIAWVLSAGVIATLVLRTIISISAARKDYSMTRGSRRAAKELVEK